MKHSVVIVAGGKGMRMGAEVPKQFLCIGNKPILMHTIDVFYRFSSDIQLIVVLPEEQQPYWEGLCNTYQFAIPHQVVSGGETRFHSVSNGLAVATGEYIAIHDGVRPFVSIEVIRRCFDKAEKFDAVIPVIDVFESIRELTDEGNKSVDRNKYKLVQTPQVFESALLRRAYQQAYQSSFTDDASVIEALGYNIKLVEGNRENIKVTTPFDLLISSALLG